VIDKAHVEKKLAGLIKTTDLTKYLI